MFSVKFHGPKLRQYLLWGQCWDLTGSEDKGHLSQVLSVPRNEFETSEEKGATTVDAGPGNGLSKASKFWAANVYR